MEDEVEITFDALVQEEPVVANTQCEPETKSAVKKPSRRWVSHEAAYKELYKTESEVTPWPKLCGTVQGRQTAIYLAVKAHYNNEMNAFKANLKTYNDSHGTKTKSQLTPEQAERNMFEQLRRARDAISTLLEFKDEWREAKRIRTQSDA